MGRPVGGRSRRIFLPNPGGLLIIHIFVVETCVDYQLLMCILESGMIITSNVHEALMQSERPILQLSFERMLGTRSARSK